MKQDRISDIQVGVDLGGTKMLLLAKARSGIVEEHLPSGPAILPRDVRDGVCSFLGRLGPALHSIGIAVPGILDQSSQIVDCDVLPNLKGCRMGDLFPALPLFVLNDAEAALAQEASFLRRDATVAVVGVGTGIGSAFQLDGKVLKGASGWAGELGSVPIFYGGDRSQVKKLDEVASGAALVSHLAMDPQSICEHAVKGDPLVMEAIHAAAHALGLGLATIIQMLTPELVSLYGGTFNYPRYFQIAVESAQQHCHPALWQRTRIRMAKGADRLVANGVLRWAAEQAKRIV
jgi:predicted NBD/HSP70 family sugar kinase